MGAVENLDTFERFAAKMLAAAYKNIYRRSDFCKKNIIHKGVYVMMIL